MQKSPRPIGVTIIAILAILVGVVGLIGGVAIATFSSLFAGIGFGVGGLLATLGFIIAGVVIFFGFIWLLTGWGFLNGKGWARTLGLIFSILSLLGTIVVAASGSIGGIVGVVILILMLYYLFTPPVKAFFRNGPSTPSFSSGSQQSVRFCDPQHLYPHNLFYFTMSLPTLKPLRQEDVRSLPRYPRQSVNPSYLLP